MRRLGEMMAEQPKATEGRPSCGVAETPMVPTLAEQGIDKNLAKRGRAEFKCAASPNVVDNFDCCPAWCPARSSDQKPQHLPHSLIVDLCFMSKAPCVVRWRARRSQSSDRSSKVR